jgi:glutamine synthetase type III
VQQNPKYYEIASCFRQPRIAGFATLSMRFFLKKRAQKFGLQCFVDPAQ